MLIIVKLAFSLKQVTLCAQKYLLFIPNKLFFTLAAEISIMIGTKTEKELWQAEPRFETNPFLSLSSKTEHFIVITLKIRKKNIYRVL